MTVEQRLVQLGLTLPQAPSPVASYVPAVKQGNWVYVSGQIPLRDGQVRVKGKVGREVTLQQAQEEAKQCALNALAVIKSVVGSLDKVERIVKVTGFVACTPEFTDAPKVVNGASDLFVQVFGEKGKHARSAVGVAALPLDCPVEVEVIAYVNE